MIFSKNLTFSEDQEITANTASTNVVDLGAPGTVQGATTALTRDIGPGRPLNLLIQVTETFDNLTSLKVSIQVDDNDSFSSAKTVQEVDVTLASLAAGYKFPVNYVPHGTDERYLRLYYTVTGTTPGAGKVTAGITHGAQTS